MKTYTTNRRLHGRTVFVKDALGRFDTRPPRTYELDPHKSQQARNHSPDGFEWGYYGSGPAQLALAILIDLYPNAIALQHYQDFKTDFIAPANHDGFIICEDDVRRWMCRRLEDVHDPLCQRLTLGRPDLDHCHVCCNTKDPNAAPAG